MWDLTPPSTAMKHRMLPSLMREVRWAGRPLQRHWSDRTNEGVYHCHCHGSELTEMREESYVGQISLTSPKGCSETSTVCSIAKLGVCRIYIFVREIVHSRFDGLQRHLAQLGWLTRGFFWRNDGSTRDLPRDEVNSGAGEARQTPLSRLVSQTDSHQWPH